MVAAWAAIGAGVWVSVSLVHEKWALLRAPPLRALRPRLPREDAPPVAREDVLAL